MPESWSDPAADWPCPRCDAPTTWEMLSTGDRRYVCRAACGWWFAEDAEDAREAPDWLPAREYDDDYTAGGA